MSIIMKCDFAKISRNFGLQAIRLLCVLFICAGCSVMAQAQTIRTETPKINVFSGTLKKVGQQAKFPISVGNKDILHLLVKTDPPEARAQLWDSLRLLNAKDQVVGSGIFTEKFSGVGSERPVRGVMTSTFKFPVKWQVETRTVRQGGLFQDRRFSSSSTTKLGSKNNASGPDMVAVGGDSALKPIIGRGFKLSDSILNYGLNNEVVHKKYYINLNSGESLSLDFYRTNLGSSYDHGWEFHGDLTSTGPDAYTIGSFFLVDMIGPSGGKRVGKGGAVGAPYSGVYAIDLYSAGEADVDETLNLNYKLYFHTSRAAKPSRDVHQAKYVAQATCCGCSHGEPVSSSSGLESYEPGADLSIYNPTGP